MNLKSNILDINTMKKPILIKMKNNQDKIKLLSSILLHLLFWTISFYFFMHNSFTRPYITNSPHKEIITFFIVIVLVYFNYFFFFSLLYKKGHHKLFWISVLTSIIFAAFIEFFYIKSDIRIIFHGHNDDFFEIFSRSVLQNLIIRDTLFVSFFILLRFYIEARKSASLERKIYEIKALYLRTRITPHYLVGVINSLESISLKEPERLPPLLDKLNMIINYTLTDAIEERVTLKEEVVFYKNYMELEYLQCIKPIDYHFEIQNINTELKIIPLLFECPINNAFKFTRKDGKGYIKIRLYQPTPVEVIFQCENNISPDRHLLRSTGMGVRNLRDRLELSYPNHYELTQKELNDIYFITIRITGLYQEN